MVFLGMLLRWLRPVERELTKMEKLKLLRELVKSKPQ